MKKSQPPGVIPGENYPANPGMNNMKMHLTKKIYLGFLLITVLCSFDFSTNKKISIVFIGDSITQGEQPEAAPPAYATAFLQKQLSGNIEFSNQGVSGCTTVDFLPS